MSKPIDTAAPGDKIILSEHAEHVYSDSQYLDLNPDWHLEDTAWKADFIGNILTKNEIEWRNAVEVGCGTGGIVFELAQSNQDKTLFGFDIAEDAAHFWPQFERPNLTLQRRDFLSKDTQRFDLLLLIDVFEHVEDYFSFLRQLSQRAEYFVFHIPLDLHVQGLLRRSHIRAREQVGHLHYFTKDSAIATLTDCGYEVIDWEYTKVAQQANAATRPLRTKLLNPIRQVVEKIAPDTTATVFGGYSLLVLCKGPGS